MFSLIFVQHLCLYRESLLTPLPPPKFFIHTWRPSKNGFSRKHAWGIQAVRVQLQNCFLVCRHDWLFPHLDWTPLGKVLVLFFVFLVAKAWYSMFANNIQWMPISGGVAKKKKKKEKVEFWSNCGVRQVTSWIFLRLSFPGNYTLQACGED